MAKTTNYNLQKDLTTDYYDIDMLNANLDIIDTEMKLIADNSSTLDTKDSTVTFVEAVEEADIVPGEKHSTLFGKILKSFKTIKANMLKPGAPGEIGTAIGANADMLDGYHAEHFNSQISSLSDSVDTLTNNLAPLSLGLHLIKNIAHEGLSATLSHTMSKNDFNSEGSSFLGAGTYLLLMTSWSTTPSTGLYLISYSGGNTANSTLTTIVAQTGATVTASGGVISASGSSGRIRLYAFS